MAQKQTSAENRTVTLIDDAGEKTTATLEAAAAIEKQETYALGVEMGRLEAFDFVATIATTGLLRIYENIKKSKSWKHLKNGDGRHFESLEDFCEVKLGKSYRRMREIASNRNAVTQELFEQSEKLGLRQADYNAIKALPAPAQELVKQAIAEGTTRDDVISVLHEVVEKFANELAEHDADREVLTKKGDLINQQIAEIGNLKLKAQKRVAAPTNWEDAFKPLLDQQHVAVTQVALKLGDVKNVIDAAIQIEVPEGEETSLHAAQKILATKVKADLEQAKEQVEAALHYFDKTLDGWL